MRIKRKNKNRLLLIGSLFLLSGFILLSIELYQNIKLKETEKEGDDSDGKDGSRKRLFGRRGA